MANETTTTGMAAFITEFNNRRILPIVKHNTVLTKLAKKIPHPRGEGVSVVYRQRLPLDTVSGAVATDNETTQETPASLVGRKFTAYLYELQNSIKPTRLLKLTDFNQLKDDSDAIANNMAESIEKHNISRVAPYLIHYRGDWDSAFQRKFITTSAGTTTTFVATALTDADHTFGGNSTEGYTTSIDRLSQNMSLTRGCTAFTAFTGTVDAFPYATGSGYWYWTSIGTGLTTGDSLTRAKLARAVAATNQLLLGSGDTFKFKNPKGMGFKLLLSTADKYDLREDTDLKAWETYNDRSDGFEQWRVGQVESCDVMEYSQVYRETVAGVYNAAGAVHNVMGIGNNCISCTELIPPHLTIVTKPDSGNPHGKFYTIAWDTTYSMEVTCGIAGFVLMTIPTSILATTA